MKKVFSIFLFFICVNEINAQFFRGVGLFGAGAISRHKWINFNNGDLVPNGTDLNGNAAYTLIPDHKSKIKPGFGVGIILEMLPYEQFRWRTEIEYLKKGAIDYAIGGDGSKVYGANKLDYIQWNNFLIWRYELFSFVPYLLAGPRLEYAIVNAPSIQPQIIGSISPIHLAWSAGAGAELVTYGNFKPFIEYHFHPDLMKLYNRNGLRVSNLTHELRLGVIYRFEGRKGEDCNAPVYLDNY